MFENAGICTVTAVVTDDFGAMSEPCRAQVTVKEKVFFVMAEGGPLLARGSYGKFLFARLGFMYQITPDKFSFTLSGGGAFSLKSEPWKSFFMVNALFNIHSGPAFFGAGVGYSSKAMEGRKDG